MRCPAGAERWLDASHGAAPVCGNGADSALHQNSLPPAPNTPAAGATARSPLPSLHLGLFCSSLLQIHPRPPQTAALPMLQLFALAPASCSQHCPVSWALPGTPPTAGWDTPPGAAGSCCHSSPKTQGYREQGGWGGTVATRVSLCDRAGVAPEGASCAWCVIYEGSSSRVAPLPGGEAGKGTRLVPHHVSPRARARVEGTRMGNGEGVWLGGLTPLCLCVELAKDGSVPLPVPNPRIQS